MPIGMKRQIQSCMLSFLKLIFSQLNVCAKENRAKAVCSDDGSPECCSKYPVRPFKSASVCEFHLVNGHRFIPSVLDHFRIVVIPRMTG